MKIFNQITLKRELRRKAGKNCINKIHFLCCVIHNFSSTFPPSMFIIQSHFFLHFHAQDFRDTRRKRGEFISQLVESSSQCLQTN